MRSKEEIRRMIDAGQAVLGIELGSTRIKAVLIDTDKSPVASGSYDWENQYVNHIWTYDINEVWKGLQGCYSDLVKNVREGRIRGDHQRSGGHRHQCHDARLSCI